MILGLIHICLPRMFERTLRLVDYGFDPDGPKNSNRWDRAQHRKTTKTDLSLNSKAKAAIAVRLLLNNGADIPLEKLPEDSQATLTQQMGNMRVVHRDTLAFVIVEFTDELERIGLSFPREIVG